MNTVLLQKIYGVCHLPVAVYHKNERLFQTPLEFQSIFDQEKELLERIAGLTQQENTPVLFQEDERIYYGAVGDREGNIYVWGPASRNPVDEALRLSYRHSHRLKKDAVLHRMEPKELVAVLSLLAYELTGDNFGDKDIRLVSRDENVDHWNQLADEEAYLLEQSEVERDHNSVEYENRLLQIVRSGDVAAMEKMLNSGDVLENEHVGVVAQKAVKQAEYLVVALITMISRAAAAEGLGVEKAYGLADIYMQRLERCRDGAEMYALAARAEYEFTKMVQEIKESGHRVLYIEQCKAYIAKNLRRPIQVGDIAPAIGINRSYLARRFSESEGITIQKYIMRERCIHAANMLRFSEYSIALIAEYFCFSSQSHFGKIFKEFYGMTPKEYRNQNQELV